MSGDAYAMGDSSGGIESCLMGKRKISAKEAVAAIRLGMDDSALMKEYGLARSGLQSLFDKLVTGGYLDLAEVQERMPGFLGTVDISEAVLPTKGNGTQGAPQPQTGRAGAWINAQEAARDVRAGLDDAALMGKYRLTSRGLRSMVDKLVTVGLITQADLDRRRLGLQEHTVALREEMLSLDDVFEYLGQTVPAKAVPPEEIKLDQIAKDTKKLAAPDISPARPQQAEQAPMAFKSPWHDNPLIVIPLLIGFFPLGFYALYLNSKLSTRNKSLITVAWISLAIISLILASEWLPWPWSLGFWTAGNPLTILSHSCIASDDQ